MSDLRFERLLAFARQIQRAATYSDLLGAIREEAMEAVGYAHAWFWVADDDSCEELRMIEMSGTQRDRAVEVATTLKVRGDAFLEEVIASDTSVVVADARTDPRTNKEIVEKLQNRTIVNVPLRLLDKPLGVFGVGTFGDEGCRPPDAAQLGYLVGMASQITVAASRIRFLEVQTRAEKERAEMERRLLQVQKLESLGLLAGGVAHDFNNLLTVIIVSAGLAQELATDPALVDEIESIRGAATRGKDLTQQLLAMSRSQELALRPLDLNVQIRQLLQLARRILPETITIDMIDGVGIPLVEGDASKLDQVFMNMLVNARDAMPSGGRLTIETEQVVVNGAYVATHPWAKPGRYLLVTVTDTGVGMPQDVRERIFEPFFTTKGQRAGTGLGLAVAYGVVRQHRGMLQCYSEPGIGTSFKVYLPALERRAADVGTKLTRPIASGKEKLLLAEDDPLVRAAATRILERSGYKVTAVEDGDKACREAAAQAFDLLILDVVMPGMPCADVMQRVRVLRPEMKIVLSSGYIAGTNIDALIAVAGRPLLRKPYDPDQVLRAVRGALDDEAPLSPPQVRE